MPFIKTIFSKKVLSGFLLLFFILPVFYFSLPTQKVYALFGVGDISFDPVQDVFGDMSALVDTGITAPATVINTANSTAFNVKTFLLDGIAWGIAKMVVQGITAQTVNWINSGFKGNPAFVTNPDVFFTNVGDQAVVAALGSSAGSVGGKILSKICTPFQPYIRLALVQQYLQQNQMGQCSIQKTIKNYEAFTNNFAQGGWEGWFSMTQNMENNPYGSYIAAQDQLTIGIANQQNKYQKQLDYGRGFLSYEKCSTTDNTSSIDANLQACEDSGKSPEECAVTVNQQVVPADVCETVTPGSVIESQLEKVLPASIDQLNLVNSINQIVSALMVQGIKGIFGGIAGGLRGLGSSNQPTSVVGLLQNTSTSTPGSAGSENAKALSDIKADLPSSLAQAVDPNATSTALIPSIDINAIKADVDASINGARAKYTPPQTPSVQ